MKRKLANWAAIALLVSFAAACGSVEKTSYNGLVGLKAAYISANGVRNDYCTPKSPKPLICIESLKVMQEAYVVLGRGSTALATYITNKAAPGADAATKLAAAKAELTALIPQFTALGLELIVLEGGLK